MSFSDHACETKESARPARSKCTGIVSGSYPRNSDVVGLRQFDRVNRKHTSYIGLGILLRPEKLPGIGPQATIWGLYAVFILLLLVSLKRQAAQADAIAPETQSPLPWQRWVLYAVVFAATAHNSLGGFATSSSGNSHSRAASRLQLTEAWVMKRT